MPCPDCGGFQTLKFAQLTWPKGKPEEAVYICEHCRARIENYQKHGMLERGEWRASAAGDGRTAGFHLSSLYSPVGWFGWGDAAKAFEEAQKNPALLQVFVNTVLGETWKQQGEAPDWQRLYDRRETYPIGTVPGGGLFLTAGADVQKDRIEVQVVAWGRGKESWLVDYAVLDGNTSLPAVWSKLTELLNTSYRSALGADLPIHRMAVDSGAMTTEVYEWVRRQAPGKVIAVKGEQNGVAPIWIGKAVDLTAKGKTIKRALRPWHVATGMLKSEFYGWLRLERPTEESGEPFPPGYCHFPQLPEEFFKQITAEQLVVKIVKGYRVPHWELIANRRNEALDTRIYARAAASHFGIDRFGEQQWQALEQTAGTPVESYPSREQRPTAPVAGPERRPRRGGNWLGNRGKDWFRR